MEAIQIHSNSSQRASVKRQQASLVLQNAFDKYSSEETNLTNLESAFNFIVEELDLPRAVIEKFRKFPEKRDDWVRSFFNLILYLEGYAIAVNGRYQRPQKR